MYETPVISTRRVRAPQDSLPGPLPLAASEALPSTRGAEGSSAYRSASATIASASSIGSLDAGGHHGEPGEPASVADPDVDGEDHRGCRADRLRGERGGAGGALGLHGDLDTGPLGGRLERLGGHVGVGDPGRAGGDAHQARLLRGDDHGCRLRSARRRGADGGRRGLDHLADQRDHLVGARGAAQRGGEVGLHEGARQLGQQLQVGGVATLGGADQEGEVGRTVLGTEVDRRRQPCEGQGRLGDARGPAVRDGDPTRQPGGGGLLPGEGVGDQLFDVGGPARVTNDPGESPDRGELVGAEVRVEPDQVSGDEVRHDVHIPWVRWSSRTRTSSGWTCEGMGMVVPGSPAAALP